MEKLVINFVPTGMVPTREMSPHVPISPDEIIDQVHEASEIGITCVHLHARDDEGRPTYKKEVYHKIVEGIKKHIPELVLCISLSGRNFNAFEKRSEALDLYPDMGSLTLSSLNFPRQASINEPKMIQALAKKMKENGVHPELEVFDLGMMNYGHYLIKKGWIEPPLYYNIITGNIAGIQCRPDVIAAAIRQVPKKAFWSLGGIGSQQLTANAMAIALGGGVRVGLEDNLYWDKGKEKLATNKQLLQRIHQLREIHQREWMTPGEFGKLGFYNKYRSEIGKTVHTR